LHLLGEVVVVGVVGLEQLEEGDGLGSGWVVGMEFSFEGFELSLEVLSEGLGECQSGLGEFLGLLTRFQQFL
jgi:hypothetical protein